MRPRAAAAELAPPRRRRRQHRPRARHTTLRLHADAQAGGRARPPPEAAASAFATATPYSSSSCSSARPRTTRTFGKSSERRARERRLSARSPRAASLRALGERRSQRKARRASAGADVDHRSLETPRKGTAASDCSTWTRQASSGSRMAVRPGVERRASIQRRSRSSVTRRQNHYMPMRLDALALGLDAGLVLQAQVDDLALRWRSSARARPVRRSTAHA